MFLRTPTEPTSERVLSGGRVAMLSFILKDAVAVVKYEIADERKGLFDGVPVNDRPAFVKLMVDYATYLKRVTDYNRHTSAVGYFLSRQSA